MFERQWRIAPPDGFAPLNVDGALRAAHDGPLPLAEAQAAWSALWTGWTTPAASAWSTTAPRDLSDEFRGRISELLTLLNEPGATWGSATLNFQLAPLDPAADQTPLLIDWRRLAEAHVAPGDPSARTDGDDPLVAAGLRLAVADDAIILTTNAFVRTQYDDQAAEAARPVVVLDERQRPSIFASPAYRENSCTTPQVWASSLTDPYPWSDEQSENATDSVAGRVYSTALSADAAQIVVVYRPLVLRTLGFACALLTFAAALWLRWLPLRYGLGGLTLGAAVALAVGQPWTWLLWGVPLGFAAALGYLSMHPQRPLDQSARGVAAPGVGAILGDRWWLPVALLLSAALVAGSLADETVKRHIFPVLLATDDDGAPTGAVYLPKPLARRLRDAARLSAQHNGWLVCDADYELTFGLATSDSAMQPQMLVAKYDIELLHESAVVEFPLDRSEWKLTGGATLDEAPIETTWSDDERKATFLLKGKGRRSLVLRWTPQSAAQRGQGRIDVSIPPVVGALLRVNLPASASPVDVVSCLGRPLASAPEPSA
ncbi:MAG: hypothetical protein KDA41_21005, partial [Planctomycetales bacterium]|nr:hypothetical protein [Planctomycetales bacterium]